MRVLERAAFATIDAASRIRLPGRGGARTLVVRSTSFGDFVTILPFLAQCARESAVRGVDVLVLSRFGRVADEFLGNTNHRCFTIDVATRAQLWHDLVSARRAIGHRTYQRAIYLGQSSEEPVARAQKLGIIRLTVGITARVVGFSRGEEVQTRASIETNLARRPTHQVLMPFRATNTAPAVSRAEVMELIHPGYGTCGRKHPLIEELGGASLVGLYVGSRLTRKRWPLVRYTTVARALLERGCHIAMLGGAEDREDSEIVRLALANSSVVNLCGRTSLRESILVYGQLDLVIGNDGAPIHFASLGGAPAVSLFCNWEAPGIWEPILAPASRSIRPAWEARQPPDYFGIDLIDERTVIDAAVELLDGARDHRIVTLGLSGARGSEGIPGFAFAGKERSADLTAST